MAFSLTFLDFMYDFAYEGVNCEKSSHFPCKCSKTSLYFKIQPAYLQTLKLYIAVWPSSAQETKATKESLTSRRYL